jgi:putative transposase
MCVRWYVAYPLSLRHIAEMVAELGVCVDHSTVHRWALKLLPVLEKAFHRRKRPVWKSWRMNETYISIKGEWRCERPKGPIQQQLFAWRHIS